MPKPDSVPAPTLRRFPNYLTLLKQHLRDGHAFISCTHIASDLHMTAIRVRKDLEMTGVVGRPRIGYAIVPLVEAIEQLLGWNSASRAVLVGAGNLGTAIIGYAPFVEMGLNIMAVFDKDEQKVGNRVHGQTVLPVDMLADIVRRHSVTIGILTVSEQAAQPVAEQMVDAGLSAIWAFTPRPIHVPSGVVVERVQLAASLAVLMGRMLEEDARRVPARAG